MIWLELSDIPGLLQMGTVQLLTYDKDSQPTASSSSLLVLHIIITSDAVKHVDMSLHMAVSCDMSLHLAASCKWMSHCNSVSQLISIVTAGREAIAMCVKLISVVTSWTQLSIQSM